MRVKYVLEKSQGQILDEKKIKNVADKVRQGEHTRAVADEIKKLTLNGIEKAKPLLKEVVKPSQMKRYWKWLAVRYKKWLKNKQKNEILILYLI